jgi:hypothetical protein
VIFVYICYQRQSLGAIAAEPIPDSRVIVEEPTDSRKDGAANRLLLAAEMILEKLVPGDIACVDAWNSVVHQQFCVKLRHASGSRDSRLPTRGYSGPQDEVDKLASSPVL